MFFRNELGTEKASEEAVKERRNTIENTMSAKVLLEKKVETPRASNFLIYYQILIEVDNSNNRGYVGSMGNIYNRTNTEPKRDPEDRENYGLHALNKVKKEEEENKATTEKRSRSTSKNRLDSKPDVVKNWPIVRMLHWLDYTSSFGLGFSLSDGSVGVFFQ